MGAVLIQVFLYIKAYGSGIWLHLRLSGKPVASYKNLFLLHFVVLIFGFTGILGKLITIEAVPLVFWRCLLASVVLGLFMGLRRRLRWYPIKTLLRFGGIGLIAGAHWITFFASIKVSTVSVALATLATAALFVSFIAPVLTGAKYDWRESLLGLLVIAGISIILSVETEYTMGIILALISAFLAAVFSTLNSLEIKRYDSLNISFYELMAASFGIFIYLIVTGSVNAELVVMSAPDWMWVLLLATVATAFAYVVAVEVMKELTPFTVALAINMEPIYSIALALVIFGEEEQMSSSFYKGAALILAAVFIDAVLKRRTRRMLKRAGTMPM